MAADGARTLAFQQSLNYKFHALTTWPCQWKLDERYLRYTANRCHLTQLTIKAMKIKELLYLVLNLVKLQKHKNTSNPFLVTINKRCKNTLEEGSQVGVICNRKVLTIKCLRPSDLFFLSNLFKILYNLM